MNVPFVLPTPPVPAPKAAARGADAPPDASDFDAVLARAGGAEQSARAPTPPNAEQRRAEQATRPNKSADRAPETKAGQSPAVPADKADEMPVVAEDGAAAAEGADAEATLPLPELADLALLDPLLLAPAPQRPDEPIISPPLQTATAAMTPAATLTAAETDESLAAPTAPRAAGAAALPPGASAAFAVHNLMAAAPPPDTPPDDPAAAVPEGHLIDHGGVVFNGPRNPVGAVPAPASTSAPRPADATALQAAAATVARDPVALSSRTGEGAAEPRSGIEAASPRAEGAGSPTHFAALLAASAPAARPALAPVATPVGHPGFAQDFGQRIVLLAAGQVRSAELALTPAELGPVRVSIEVRGQDATIVFGAAAAATRAALEEAMPRLRDMLAQQGLNLAESSVGDQLGHQRGEAYGRPRSEHGADRPRGEAAALDVAATSAAFRRPVRLIDVTA